MNYIIATLLFVASLAVGGILYRVFPKNTVNQPGAIPKFAIFTTPAPTPSPTPAPIPIPSSHTIPGGVHMFQTFNNCGPASLSMALSLYGINVSQQSLGQALRPYQVPGGDNDDKSVTLTELGEYAKNYGLIPYHRPAGDMETLKRFIAMDIPVLTRTLTHTYEDIGHFRLIKGYDDTLGTILQDDSLQGANRLYSYDEFNALWQQFGYEYLVLVPKEKQSTAERILDHNFNSRHAWTRARDLALVQEQENPENMYASFNLSVAYYHLGDYAKSDEAFSRVESKLPMRTLWYQLEPLLSLYELGRDDRLFAITDKILNGGNRAYSELYIIRGDMYKRNGQTDLAKGEYEKAVFYNSNLGVARERLRSATSP